MRASKSAPTNIDDYLADFPAKVRKALEGLRQTIKSVVPEAEEVISYNMPAFKYNGMLVYFSAFKNHCSLFPANSSLIAKMKSELKSFKTSKGTIQFTTDKPLPVALVKEIVRARMKENLAKARAKQLMKSPTRKPLKKKTASMK